jgi:hypothetical protein
MGTMRNLLRWGIRITVDRDDLNAIALETDDDFLAQLTATKQHDPGGHGGFRGTYLHDLDST